MKEIKLHYQDIKKFSYNFANKLKIKDIVTFSGDLGAGKTTICRHIIQYHLGNKVIVNSPTFNLLNIYKNHHLNFYHYDLYRLKHFNEIYELGLEDTLKEGICLIEWPEIIINIIPKKRIEINIEYINKYTRFLKIKYYAT